MIFDDSDKKADARFEEIVSALKNQDRDALKAMFSTKALSEASDFDDCLEYFFELVQDKPVSWERNRFRSSESYDHGKKSIKLWSWYILTTDKDKFMFYITDYTIDTIDPDNAGFYTIRAIRAEDEKTQFVGTWEDMEIAGIYKPE